MAELVQVEPSLEGLRDRATVTADGERLEPWIDGVITRRLAAIEDDRGAITELYRSDWQIHPAPLVHVYEVTLRPDTIKGWVVHKEQDDRLTLLKGTVWWALFDARPDSPTFRQLNHFIASRENRSLLIIPAGVYHAVKNIGTRSAMFLNMPTKPYRHASPDKYRLAMDGHSIPFIFGRPPRS